MNTNQQFAVSCHILVILAAYPDITVTSETIAESVDTNPVVIRRIMSHLRQYGLVDSRPGASGGWRLVRVPSEISLRDVYYAVSHHAAQRREHPSLYASIAMHPHPNPDCPIGANIQNALGSVFADAQTALELSLDRVSVANVLENILRNPAERTSVLAERASVLIR